MIRARRYPHLIAGAIIVCSVSSAHAADARKITLKEAVDLAISQNRALRIARLKIVESEQRKAGQRASYFPSVVDHAKADHNTGIDHIGIPAGALGSVNGTLVPGHNILLPQGSDNLLLNEAKVSQPVTQLIRIHEANRIAAAEVAMSRDDLKKAETQVAVDVENLYFGILVAKLQKQSAGQQFIYATEQLRENEQDVRNGNALQVAVLEARTALLESRQAELNADLQISDLTTELNNVMGLPPGDPLDFDSTAPVAPDVHPRGEYLQAAWAENPDISSAEEVIRKARAAVASARSEYIPDLNAYVSNTWQDGIAFIVRNFSTVGAELNWNVFDFGKRRSAVREREAQLAEAEENLRRLKDDVETQIAKSYDKLERTRNLIGVEAEVVNLRTESERVTQNQLKQGEVNVSEERRASAAIYKSRADLLQANLNYLLAWAELQQTIGRVPVF
jgi:outer membrane protein TolC